MEQLGHTAHYWDIEQQPRGMVAEQIIKVKPDLLISLWQHALEDEQLWNAITLACKKKAFWWVDYNHHADQLPHDELDAVLVSNKVQAAWFEEQWDVPRDRYHYLPDGCYQFPSYESVITAPCEKPEVLFIGTTNDVTHKRRTDLIRAAARIAHVSIKCTQNWQERQKADEWQPSMYQKATINLSISLVNDVPGYTSTRLFDIASCGGFILAEWFPGCEELFEPNKEVVYFDGPDELQRMILRYRDRPEERAAIGRAAFDRCQKEHLMKHRVARIIQAVESPRVGV